MRYSIEPKNRIYVKDYRFLSFPKNRYSLSNKYSQKLLDSAKKFGATKVATNAIKTASKRAIHQTAEATGDLINNKIADKITSVSKKSSRNNLDETKNEIEISKERYISPEKIPQIIDKLRLV